MRTGCGRKRAVTMRDSRSSGDLWSTLRRRRFTLSRDIEARRLKIGQGASSGASHLEGYGTAGKQIRSGLLLREHLAVCVSSQGLPQFCMATLLLISR